MRDLTTQPFYNVIKEFEHWVVVFRDRQVTIGSVIIMARDTSKDSLGELSAEAWAQFGEACQFVEGLLKKVFGAEKFNYLALMMFDPEVHFHVIPRYSKPVTFEGQEFIDPDWPKATKKIALELDEVIKEKIKNTLVGAAA